MLALGALPLVLSILIYISTFPDIDIPLRVPRIYRNDTLNNLNPLKCSEKRFIKEDVLTEDDCIFFRRITDIFAERNPYDTTNLVGAPYYDVSNKLDKMKNGVDDLNRWKIIREQIRREVEEQLSPNKPLYNEFTLLTRRGVDKGNDQGY